MFPFSNQSSDVGQRGGISSFRAPCWAVGGRKVFYPARPGVWGCLLKYIEWGADNAEVEKSCGLNCFFHLKVLFCFFFFSLCRLFLLGVIFNFCIFLLFFLKIFPPCNLYLPITLYFSFSLLSKYGSRITWISSLSYFVFPHHLFIFFCLVFPSIGGFTG